MPDNPACGIYLLDYDKNRSVPSVNDRIGRASIKFLSKPFVDGLALRPTWLDFSHEGFGYIAVVCARLQALDKKLSLYIDFEVAPPNVVAAAQETYVAKVKSHNGFIYPKTCAPWDRPSLDAYKTLINGLAHYPCPDGTNMVPFHLHPVLAALRINVIGRTHTARDLYNNLTSIPGWSRQRYLDAVVECLTVAQDAFPGIPLHTGFFSIKDNISTPSLDRVLIKRLTETFDGSNRARIGVFMELLTQSKPKNDGDYGQNLRALRNRGFYVAFQALNCWADPFGNAKDFDRRDGFDGVDPFPALAHGFNDFGTRYFEMYPPDLIEKHWPEAKWQEWHERVWQ